MRDILKLLCIDVLQFFIAYAIFSVVVSKLSEKVPRSWDPTGIGMLVLIFLVIGFLLGSYKIGAAYSDNLKEQKPGTVLSVFKRPIRSVKYGLISLILNIALLYLVIVVSDYFNI